MKPETYKNITKQAKGAIKEFRHKRILVDMLTAMQKAGNVNCTLKLPVKTRWASMVTSLESVKKNKVVLCKIAVSEEREKKAATCQKKSGTLLQAAITQLEEDSPNLANVCRLFFNLNMKS